MPKSYQQSWEKISRFITNFYERMQAIQEEAMKPLQEIYRTIAGWNEFQKKIGIEVKQLMEQFKTAIEEGIDNFEEPEKYDAKAVKVHPWTEELVLREGVSLLEELKASHFSYMFDRYKRGLDAHLRGEYQLSIFTFLSMIDGMLKEFCKLHKKGDCKYARKYPTFDKSLNHFTKHYKFEAFVGRQKFKERLDAFFQHRHQIMHGDRYAHFDKNISTVALLFLTLVHSAVKDALRE